MKLEALLERTRDTVRAPRGFADRVMDAVYRESLGGRSRAPEAAGLRVWPRATVSRLYRRLGWSFMLTAVVLAMSLLIPHGAYSTLIRPGNPGPSAAVHNALMDAGEAVKEALGERQNGGRNE